MRRFWKLIMKKFAQSHMAGILAIVGIWRICNCRDLTRAIYSYWTAQILSVHVSYFVYIYVVFCMFVQTYISGNKVLAPRIWPINMELVHCCKGMWSLAGKCWEIMSGNILQVSRDRSTYILTKYETCTDNICAIQ